MFGVIRRLKIAALFCQELSGNTELVPDLQFQMPSLAGVKFAFQLCFKKVSWDECRKIFWRKEIAVGGIDLKQKLGFGFAFDDF